MMVALSCEYIKDHQIVHFKESTPSLPSDYEKKNHSQVHLAVFVHLAEMNNEANVSEWASFT